MYLKCNLSLSANALQINFVYLRTNVLSTPYSLPTFRSLYPSANFLSTSDTTFSIDNDGL